MYINNEYGLATYNICVKFGIVIPSIIHFHDNTVINIDVFKPVRVLIAWWRELASSCM